MILTRTKGCFWVVTCTLSMVLTLAQGGLVLGQTENTPSSVKFEVVAKRHLTEKEIKQLGNVFGITLAVRLRLTNIGPHHILYLSNSGTVVPAGYHLIRNVGKSEWKSTSNTRGREGPPGSELRGVSYSWIELPPGAVVEVDAHDWIKADEEHAFSTFVKMSSDSTPQEVVTDPYRPI